MPCKCSSSGCETNVTQPEPPPIELYRIAHATCEQMREDGYSHSTLGITGEDITEIVDNLNQFRAEEEQNAQNFYFLVRLFWLSSLFLLIVGLLASGK